MHQNPKQQQSLPSPKLTTRLSNSKSQQPPPQYHQQPQYYQDNLNNSPRSDTKPNTTDNTKTTMIRAMLSSKDDDWKMINPEDCKQQTQHVQTYKYTGTEIPIAGDPFIAFVTTTRSTSPSPSNSPPNKDGLCEELLEEQRMMYQKYGDLDDRKMAWVETQRKKTSEALERRAEEIRVKAAENCAEKAESGLYQSAENGKPMKSEDIPNSAPNGKALKINKKVRATAESRPKDKPADKSGEGKSATISTPRERLSDSHKKVFPVRDNPNPKEPTKTSETKTKSYGGIWEWIW